MTDAPLRVLVVDDEPAARRGLIRQVTGLPWASVVGECSNGREAVTALQMGNVDVALLDVEMPELDGFGVLQEVELASLPLVIFVTAFDRYALAAFEAHALDYVVKPVDPSRLEEALSRARAAISSRDRTARLERLVAELRGDSRSPDRIAARIGNRTRFVSVDRIQWLEAADNYVRLHTDGDVVLIRETLTGLLERLDGAAFRRIHRSHAVRVDQIEEEQTRASGDARIRLRDGTWLSVSRRFR